MHRPSPPSAAPTAPSTWPVVPLSAAARRAQVLETGALDAVLAVLPDVVGRWPRPRSAAAYQADGTPLHRLVLNPIWADPSPDGEPPAPMALLDPRWGTVWTTLLRAWPVDLTVNGPRGHGTTALHLAATHGATGAVRALLDVGADPRALDEKGQTPLHLAAAGAHLGTVNVLLEAGVPADLRNDHALRTTPLMELLGADPPAPRAPRTETARPNESDGDDGTTLPGDDPDRRAARRRAVGERLLAAGADPNACNDRGESLLASATVHHDVSDAIGWLVEAGADPEERDSTGATLQDRLKMLQTHVEVHLTLSRIPSLLDDQQRYANHRQALATAIVERERHVLRASMAEHAPGAPGPMDLPPERIGASPTGSTLPRRRL